MAGQRLQNKKCVSVLYVASSPLILRSSKRVQKREDPRYNPGLSVSRAALSYKVLASIILFLSLAFCFT